MKRVYFLRPIGQLGPIKIGSSNEPDSRLRVICSWSPLPLEIAATFPGGNAEELAIHHRFAHLSMHGEWFAVDDELAVLVEAIAAGHVPTVENITGPSTITRQMASLKSVITRRISDAEKRAYSHRLNHGTGRPSHIRAILETFQGANSPPPSIQNQRALAEYLADLQALPSYTGSAQESWVAWQAYRDGPYGIAADRRVA